MRLPEPARRPGALAKPHRIAAGVARPGWLAMLVDVPVKTMAIADMEVRKLWHDPTELATRAIQPALWLLIFGQVMSRARVIDTAGLPYLDFLMPGILAQSVLFIAIFNGISIIWERDLGIVHKFLASPAPRVSLVLGKALGGGVRALIQAIVVLALSAVIGVHMRTDFAAFAGLALFVVTGAAVFSSFSLIVACLVKTRERFMGVGQLLTMPLFFASNAIYPTSMMPRALRVISALNPLTYQVDALRILLLPGFNATARFALAIDFAVLVGVLALMAAISARLYAHIAQ
ncbi:ABC transporter permease [Paraburkholderia sp. HD33-4]|uniref:ABC transporter permease n=1 Tax=Paraburkholderia sp. HD33-4 TaxID=2883242 RepID=UPI001F39437E|nr:ABC transporter permease [Paraburkholderia sp. HD33-4]